jgi:transcription elongation factor GreA
MEELEEIVLTKEGYEQKKKELEEYRRILHEQIPKSLKVAKEYGGELRENKEFLDIQSQKEFYEAEVRRLEEILDRAKVIDEASISTRTAGIGTRVTLKDMSRKSQVTYELVGQAEVDLEANKISISSPLGKALVGRKKGEVVELETPAGKIRYSIVGIQRG